MVEITVADTGCGISEEILQKIFDPFFTTKGVGKGTGLGLSVSHGTIEAHGGLIEVESKVGIGTVFRIYLPLGGKGQKLLRKGE
jgi:signal transduction histidine kinase